VGTTRKTTKNGMTTAMTARCNNSVTLPTTDFVSVSSTRSGKRLHLLQTIQKFTCVSCVQLRLKLQQVLAGKEQVAVRLGAVLDLPACKRTAKRNRATG
jgi:hypothetical protein